MGRTEHQAKRVFEDRAEHYTTSPAHADRETLERLVELADLDPGDLALDVATGTAHAAVALAEHVEVVLGVDLTRRMLSEGRRLASGARGRVELVLGDAHALPVSSGSLDVVVCRRSAHHFSKLPEALDEMRRVLGPGGRLVVDDRSVPEDPFVDEVVNRLDAWHDPSHVRQHPPSAWNDLLEAAGFEVRGVERYERRRPVSSLTGKASPEHADRIRETLEALSPDERDRVGYEPGSDEAPATILHRYLIAWADAVPP